MSRVMLKSQEYLAPVFIDAFDLDDAWFQCLSEILEKGHVYTITRGSYAGQRRLEFDFVTVRVKKPAHQIIPIIPEGMSIPAPTDMDYIQGYLGYLLTGAKTETEDYCYSEDTEILTDKGWKYFKDLDKTEKVATLNPNTNKIEYQKPISYIKFKYNSWLYNLNNKKVNFSVNSKHKIFVGARNNFLDCQKSGFSLKKIDDVLNFKYLKFKRNGIWMGKNIKYFVLPKIKYSNTRYFHYGKELKLDMKDWLTFFGLWLTEGDLARYKTNTQNQNHYMVRISLTNNEDRKLAKTWCEKLGFKTSEYRRWLLISNKQLYKYLEQFGKAHDKFIPGEFKILSTQYLQVLFDSMMFGDGNKDGSRYNTVSPKLANDFCDITFKLGKVTNIKFDIYQSKTGFKNNGIYKIGISNCYLEPTIKNTIKKISYNNYLYCVGLPKYHIVYIRHKGICHWSGNTYGERLVGRLQNSNIVKDMPLSVNQVEEVIKIYKTQGHGTNQAIMEIGMPSDIKLADPPCLRLIDTRVRYGKLHFILYFRSWDLWGGFPSNLGGLQLVKQYMAQETGVEDGEIIAVSKGLHLYDYAWDLAKARTNKPHPSSLQQEEKKAG